MIVRAGADVRWWTWAGYRSNATLAATLSGLTDDVQRFDDASIRMRADLTHEMWRAGTADATQRLCLPELDQRALAGLKFNEALPKRLAMATLAARLADLDSAARVLAEPAASPSSTIAYAKSTFLKPRIHTIRSFCHHLGVRSLDTELSRASSAGRAFISSVDWLILTANGRIGQGS